MREEEVEKETIKEEMDHLLEEARMLLPGIQALFGFQTIAVFNDRFSDLPMLVKDAHLVGLGLVVLAIALVITPAAYHRMAEPGCISHRTIKWASRLICGGLAPLACGLSLDVFVVIYSVTTSMAISVSGGVAAFAVLIGLWFVFPLAYRRRKQKRSVRRPVVT
jgi:hypothetical protein